MLTLEFQNIVMCEDSTKPLLVVTDTVLWALIIEHIHSNNHFIQHNYNAGNDTFLVEVSLLVRILFSQIHTNL
jgi:hypothetical protein